MEEKKEEVRKYQTIEQEGVVEPRLSGPGGRSGTSRALVFIFLSLSAVCQFFCYQGVIRLEEHVEKDLRISSMEFELLIAFYYIPNFLLPIFAGLISDNFGRKWSMFGFYVVLIFGRFVFSTGSLLKEYPVCMLGRIIFGIGNESVKVISYAALSDWNPRFVELSLAILTSALTVGMLGCNLLLPMIYEHFGLDGAFLALDLVAILGFLFAIGYLIVDYCAESPQQFEGANLCGVTNFSCMFWAIMLTFGLFSFATQSFIFSSPTHIKNRFGLTQSIALIRSYIPYAVMIVFLPIWGCILRSGKRLAFACLIASACLLANFMFLSSLRTIEMFYVFVVFFGLIYSLFAASIYPSITYITPRTYLGAAFGIAFCFNNLFCFLGQIISEFLIDKSFGNHPGYTTCTLFNSLFALFALVFGVIIFFLDYCGSAILHNGEPDKLDESDEIIYPKITH